MMKYLPKVYEEVTKQFPEVLKAYDDLAQSCHQSGPLDAKTRRLIKLGIAIGSSSEGAVRSHARRAIDEGVSPGELKHAVLLALTTVGFPTMIAAMKWVEEVIKKLE
ncbi:carboxymuconolactone decarboxylase family protein [Chloroflexota bacterium]